MKDGLFSRYTPQDDHGTGLWPGFAEIIDLTGLYLILTGETVNNESSKASASPAKTDLVCSIKSNGKSIKNENITLGKDNKLNLFTASSGDCAHGVEYHHCKRRDIFVYV